MACWVVKGRPDRNDLERMLVPGQRGPWITRRPPRNWAEGEYSSGKALLHCGWWASRGSQLSSGQSVAQRAFA